MRDSSDFGQPFLGAQLVWSKRRVDARLATTGDSDRVASNQIRKGAQRPRLVPTPAITARIAQKKSLSRQIGRRIIHWSHGACGRVQVAARSWRNFSHAIRLRGSGNSGIGNRGFREERVDDSRWPTTFVAPGQRRRRRALKRLPWPCVCRKTGLSMDGTCNRWMAVRQVRS